MQDQYAGLILIMSVWKNISVHVNHISIKNHQKYIRGQEIKTYILFVLPIGN